MPSSFRQMVPADWAAIHNLHAQQAPVYRSHAAWRWRYVDQPHGTSESTGVVAEADDGDVRAFVGGSYRKVWLQGQERLAFVVHDAVACKMDLNGDTELVDALLVKGENALRKLTHRHAAVHLALLTPGEMGQGALTSTHGENIELPWRECSLSPLDETPGCTCLVRPTDFTEPGWNALWESRRVLVSASGVRDQAYLAWRFGRCPAENVTGLGPYWCFAFWSVASVSPVGYAVLRPDADNVAILVDVVWPQHLQALRDGMRQIADFLTARGVTRLQTAMTSTSPEFAYLDSLGFIPLRAQHPVPFSARWLDACGTPAFQWSVTLGDSLLY